MLFRSYLENSDERYEFYHRHEERLPFDLDFFNKITKGGLPAKTLNIALAGTGVGKSLFMCHVGAGALVQGKNVLYITMEMAEERIAERIDANLLNVSLDDLVNMPNFTTLNDRKYLVKLYNGSNLEWQGWALSDSVNLSYTTGRKEIGRAHV